MFNKCPGAASIRRPTIKIKNCPECGDEVEIFSDEVQVECRVCGFIIYNNVQSCVQWCRYAIECVGEEKYLELTRYHNGEKD